MLAMLTLSKIAISWTYWPIYQLVPFGGGGTRGVLAMDTKRPRDM